MSIVTRLSGQSQTPAPIPLTARGTDRPEFFEYAALKQEQIARIGLRETALYANLAVSASVLAVFFQDKFDLTDQILLLMPFVTGVMFWIYFNNDYYVNFIGDYISNDLTNQILGSAPADHAKTQRETAPLFGWEQFHKRRTVTRRARKFVGAVTLLVSFMVLPTFALIRSLDFAASDQAMAIIWFAGVIVSDAILFGILSLTWGGRR